MSPRVAGIRNECLRVGRNLLLVCLAAAGFAVSQTPPAQPQVTAIRSTVAALQKIQPPPDEREHPEGVPEAARPLLKQLKHQLRDLIAATLNAQSANLGERDRLAEDLIGTLKSGGVIVGDKGSPDTQFFGGVYDIKIRRPAGHPELLAAVTDMQIPCGEDASLYLFQRDGAKWNLVLALEANDYPEISGGQGDFDFAVSPSDSQGKWFVIATNLSPWCSSCWNGIYYRVVQPGPDPYSPVVLFKGSSDMMYRCTEGPSYKLRVDADGFQTTYTGSLSLDVGVWGMDCIDHYQVAGGHWRRTAPLAQLPYEFLDRWMELPWNEVARWSDSSKTAVLERWHERLSPHYERRDPERYYYSSYIDFAQPCGKTPARWQIGVSIDSEKRVDRLPEELFFTVTKHGEAFYLQRIDTIRPPGCPGETPPAGQAR